MTARAAAAAVATLAALALLTAGCGSADPKPIGKVVELELDEECSGKGTKKRCHDEYDLTVRTAGGNKVDVEDVPESYITSCELRARYPECAEEAATR